MKSKARKNYPKWVAACVKHGAYLGGKERPEHYVWRTMLRRCCSPKASERKAYSGVVVSPRWLKYENFFADMGPRPTAKHSIDRYPDAFGDYESSNCRWATPTEQAQNRRTTPHYVCAGFIGTSGAWARVLGISGPLARFRWKAWGTFVKGRKWRCVPPNRLIKARSQNISIY